MKNLNIRITKRTKATPFVKTASEAFRSPNVHWYNAPYCMMLAGQNKDIINASIYERKGNPLHVRTLCDIIGAVAENETLTVEHVTCGWRVEEGWETAVVRVWNLEAFEKQTRPDQLLRDLTPFKRSFKKGANSPFAQKVVEATKSNLVCYSEPRELVEVIAHAEGRALLLVGTAEENGYVSPLFLDSLIEAIHNQSPPMRVKSCRFYDKHGIYGWKMVFIQVFDEAWLKADIRAKRADRREAAEQRGPLSEEQRRNMRSIRQILIDAGANPLLNRDPDEDPANLLDSLFDNIPPSTSVERCFGSSSRSDEEEDPQSGHDVGGSAAAETKPLEELVSNKSREESGKSTQSTPADFETLCRSAFELFLQNPKRASISFIQRKFNIGYGKAASVIDELEERGYIGESRGPNEPREILKSKWEDKPIENDDFDEDGPPF